VSSSPVAPLAGVFFDHDKGKTHSSGKLLFSARVIPYPAPGSTSSSTEDHVFVRIDRRRKAAATSAAGPGYGVEDVLERFFETDTSISR